MWWLRDFIDDAQLKDTLKKTGWIDEDIDNVLKAAFFIPPVQDLITMAVREVFTPEIAEAFGQFEDFPPEFVTQAKKQGVSEEWARNYWGAHWRLPSVQMGFEMLHRQVIDTKELSLLMRASDIMPFWREKLIEISFSPLTRVDIRRMHRVGVLTEDQVNRAYHDIGYSDENAERLTDFTLKINEGFGDEDDNALADLTRGNIIAFLKDGVLSGEEAQNLLVATGSSEEAAELFILSAELELEAEARKDAVALVLEKFKGGTTTFSSAQRELEGLGLTEFEKQKALNTLEREQARANKLPSKADLDKFRRRGIIEDSEYLSQMRLIGFSELWSGRFLQLIGGADDGTTEQGAAS